MDEDLYFQARYRAIALISQGKWSKTFLAVDEATSASIPCFVKQRSPQLYAASFDKAIKLFEQEALQLKKLGNHPQIPKLLDYFSFEQCFYLVQEFIDGSNLEAVSEQQGVFTEAQIWQLLAQLLPVIEFIGDAGCIHRDIQPKNIIRPVGDRSLVLTGFSSLQLQINSKVVGSAEYVAPEQARGKTVFASDLYSLGVTCIYLLTQVSPFDLFDVANDCWTWRDYLTHKVSDRLADIIDKLIQRDLDKRWQSATEVMQQIDPPRLYAPPKPSKSLQSCLHTLNLSTPVNAVAISPQGRILACGGDNKAIALCDLATQKIVSTLYGHFQAIRAVAFSPDGKILASGSDDRAIVIWDFNTTKEICISAHSAAVRALAFSPNGQILASASADKTIKLWDTSTYQEICTLSGHQLPVTAIAFHPQGNLLASASCDRTIRLWQLSVNPTDKLENRPQYILKGHVWAVLAVAFSPNGKILATSGDDRTIVIWDVATGQEIRTLSGHSWSVVTLCFSSDSETLFSGSWDKSIKAWQISTGVEIATFNGHNDSVTAIAICPITQLIASGSKDATVKLWSLGNSDLAN